MTKTPLTKCHIQLTSKTISRQRRKIRSKTNCLQLAWRRLHYILWAWFSRQFLILENIHGKWKELYQIHVAIPMVKSTGGGGHLNYLTSAIPLFHHQDRQTSFKSTKTWFQIPEKIPKIPNKSGWMMRLIGRIFPPMVDGGWLVLQPFCSVKNLTFDKKVGSCWRRAYLYTVKQCGVIFPTLRKLD